MFGGLLLYARAVDNKLLVVLSKIGTQKAAVTKQTNEDILQFLDYVATYPNGGIIYRSRNMILAAHADVAYLNVSKACTFPKASLLLHEVSHSGSP